jgi:hypothetical protein
MQSALVQAYVHSLGEMFDEWLVFDIGGSWQ